MRGDYNEFQGLSSLQHDGVVRIPLGRVEEGAFSPREPKPVFRKFGEFTLDTSTKDIEEELTVEYND